MTEDYDTTEKVEKTRHGATLKVKSTRGTGTRDQDTVEAEYHAETVSEVLNHRKTMLEAVEQSMNKRRAHQPDGDDDE